MFMLRQACTECSRSAQHERLYFTCYLIAAVIVQILVFYNVGIKNMANIIPIIN